jgi:TolB-like protein
MKTNSTFSKAIIIILVLISSVNILIGQSTSSRPTMAVADIDANETYPGSNQRSLSEIARLEMERIEAYELMDRYDMSYISQKDDVNISGCFSKICLTEIGKQLKVDYVLTGSVITVGKNIYTTFKVLNVKSGIIEKSKSNEFLNIPEEVKSMIRITLNDLFAIPNEQELLVKLTKKNDFDNSINNPYQLKLRSDGPRMGFTVFEGALASRLKENQATGGFDAQPVMFQFGYQFEKQYLNEGNFQALFEFIPMVTGLDQGLFIPSLTLMNGLRNNKNGWEFAFGPTVSLVTKARGFYSPENGKWTLANDSIAAPAGVAVFDRLDSRGEVAYQPGFVFAFGKTFKSGRLNIPVNGYLIPNRDGMRIGLSVGFNARDRYALNGSKIK